MAFPMSSPNNFSPQMPPVKAAKKAMQPVPKKAKAKAAKKMTARKGK